MLNSISQQGKASVIPLDKTAKGKQAREKIRLQLLGAGLITSTGPARGCYDLERFFNRLFTISLDFQERVMDDFKKTFDHFVQINSLGPINTGVKGKVNIN